MDNNTIMTEDGEKTIVDELCTCGCLKSQHNDTKYKGITVADGHGSCTVCLCEKFSWGKFVFAE